MKFRILVRKWLFPLFLLSSLPHFTPARADQILSCEDMLTAKLSERSSLASTQFYRKVWAAGEDLKSAIHKNETGRQISVEEALSENLRVAAEGLRFHGISFDIKTKRGWTLKNLFPRYESWSYLEILPDRHTLLGKFAGKLRKKYDADIVYDPLSLQRERSYGKYEGTKNRIYIDDAAIGLGKFSRTLIHEYRHLIQHRVYDRDRRGRSLLSIRIVPDTKIAAENPERFDGYQEGFQLDEISNSITDLLVAMKQGPYLAHPKNFLWALYHEAKRAKKLADAAVLEIEAVLQDSNNIAWYDYAEWIFWTVGRPDFSGDQFNIQHLRRLITPKLNNRTATSLVSASVNLDSPRFYVHLVEADKLLRPVLQSALDALKDISPLLDECLVESQKLYEFPSMEQWRVVESSARRAQATLANMHFKYHETK